MLVWYEIVFSFFFFNDTATTEIYTLSLHDALPICGGAERVDHDERRERGVVGPAEPVADGGGAEMGHRDRLCVHEDRKSTRLNSSHANISYAVFCLKKKT